MPEDLGEESGLSVEAGKGAVIPNYVIGFRDFDPEIRLRCQNGFRQRFIKPAKFPKPPALGGRRTGDNEDTVEMRFRPSFVQQRYINKKPSLARGTLRRPSAPTGANAGMQDLLE